MARWRDGGPLAGRANSGRRGRRGWGRVPGIEDLGPRLIVAWTLVPVPKGGSK